MAASKNTHLCYSVAERVADEVRRLPMGFAAQLLDTSKPAISRLRAGQLSSVPLLLKAIEQFGVRILEPIIGKFDDESLFRRLDTIERLLGEVRHARPQSAAQASLAHRNVGAAVGAGEGHGRQRRGLVRPPVPGVCSASETAPLALVQIRRPSADLARDDLAQLRRHLTSNVVSLDAARNYAKQHRNVGVAWKERGRDWTVLPAPDNRFWNDTDGPRPLATFPVAAEVVPLRQGFEEAARALEPILFERSGFIGGAHFHSDLLRWGGIANDGTELCLAAFERRA